MARNYFILKRNRKKIRFPCFLFFLILTFAFPTTYAGQVEHLSASDWQVKLVLAAKERLQHQVTYSGQYYSIAYPNGDVPDHIGVCTDVIIRSYRQLGVDLQQLVHEDMRDNFGLYPKNWGLKKPDPNIDHRRVPNLQVFLTRYGESLPVSQRAEDYQPGDLVTWMLPGNLPHIGIVSDQKLSDSGNWLIIHNVGRGPKLEDFLFAAPITGHYRYSVDKIDTVE